MLSTLLLSLFLLLLLFVLLLLSLMVTSIEDVSDVVVEVDVDELSCYDALM